MMDMGNLWTRKRTRPLIVLAVSVFALTAAAPASAAGTLTWSAPQLVDHEPPFAQMTGLDAVSCPSVSLCVAVGGGDVAASTDPTGGLADWHSDVVFRGSHPSEYLGAVSCASASLCVAGGTLTGLVISTNPTGGTGAWRQTVPLPASDVTGVSCPSVRLCVAVTTGEASGTVPSGGDVLISTDPTGGPGAWKIAAVEHQPGGLTSVSCPSTSLCVAGDVFGNVVTSTDPTGGVSAWQTKPVEHEPDFTLHGLRRMSCPSAALCVAVDDTGNVLTSTDPTGGTQAWTVTTNAGGLGHIQGVSCASTTLCVAAAGPSGDVVTSTDPTGGASAWTAFTVDRITGPAPSKEEIGPNDVSCPSTSLCVAVDGDGNTVTSTAPLGGAGTWSVQRAVDGVNSLTSLSCPSTSLCVAVDNAGHVVTTTDPAAGPSSWTASEIDPGNSLLGVSCPSVDLCVAADDAGNILASTNPTVSGGWAVADVDGTYSVNGISCPSTSLCVAVDDDGNAITSTDPAGGASTWTVADLLGVGAQGGRGGGGGYFYDVSCASASLCFATANGQVVTSTNPTGGAGAWKATALNGFHVSCPLSSRCFAAGYTGLLTSDDPAGPAPTWTTAHAELGFPCAANILADPCGPLVFTGGEVAVQDVSCPSATFCAGINSRGFASTSTGRSHVGDWTATNVDDSVGPFPVSCPSTSLCVAVDTAGDALIGSPAESDATGYVGTAGLGRASDRTGTARVPVRCAGASVATCRVTLVLTATETLTRRRPVGAITTAGTTRRTVTIGAATVVLTAGRAKTASVKLNRTGRHLLSTRHRFPATLTATQVWLGGYAIPLPTQTLTFKASRKG